MSDFFTEYFFKNEKVLPFLMEINELKAINRGTMYKMVDSEGRKFPMIKSVQGELAYDTLKKIFKDSFGLELTSYSVRSDDSKEDWRGVVVNVDLNFGNIFEGEKTYNYQESFFNEQGLSESKPTILKMSWKPIKELATKMEGRKFIKWGGVLAGNRFTEKEAEEFIEKLYNLGALKVETDMIDQDQKTSDLTVIHMPDNGEQREKLFEICNEEMVKEWGKDGIEADNGQKVIELHWD